MSLNSTESRALALLGAGIAAETVASALGVTPARISQLLSDEEFARQVTELKFHNLQKHNVRDSTYDTIEDSLLEKFQEMMPLLVRPMEILKAMHVINGAKRRGQSTPDAIHTQQTIVQLNMPVQVIAKFAKDVNNQVIEAGEQTLLTIPSSKLRDLSKEYKNGSGDETRTPISRRIAANPIHNL